MAEGKVLRAPGQEAVGGQKVAGGQVLSAQGQVVKLDRGFPLVKLENGELVRCKHATVLVKGATVRAVIGDLVEVSWPDGHDKAIISDILPRETELVRKDPAERAVPQVLAANFQRVLIAQPLAEVNMRRLERELVLAHESGAEVCVVLTKADLAENAGLAEQTEVEVQALAGTRVPVFVISEDDPAGLAQVSQALTPGSMTVLVGKSGVGKSSLINLLAGAEVQQTGAVREGDGKGRHTTVSREIIDLPGGARIVDMPGVRGLGMWESDAGIGAAFADVEELAQQCRFGDCKHVNEPGCAVRAAVADGTLSAERLESYLGLKAETEKMRERKEQARWAQKDKDRRGVPGSKTRGRGSRKR